VALGDTALALSSGDANTALGASALEANTTASDNTAVGARALYVNTTGSQNTAVGRLALVANTSASNNTAVGYQAGYSAITSGYNTFIGQTAGYSTTGAGNTFVGCTNTSVGAGYFVTTGNKNTIIGGYHGNQGGLDIRTLSNHIVLSDGDGNPRVIVDSSGAVTMPLQPAFLARNATLQSNIALGTQVTVVFGTEVFDQNADFASNTFTAPVTGRYQFSYSLYLNALDEASDYYIFCLQTSNRIYESVIDPGVFATDPVYWNQSFSILTDMDAGDTAYVWIQQANGTAQTDLAVYSSFSGYLVA
jgi:trimeric autotransporter adhesin